MKIIMLSPQKVVAVAYERCSFTRVSNYRALTGKKLAFWIGGRTWRFNCSIQFSFFCLLRYLATPYSVILYVLQLIIFQHP